MESFTNVIESAKTTKEDSDETVNVGEVKKQWATGDPKVRRNVVFSLIGRKLGLTELDPSHDFTNCGGNSFGAMRIIGQLRTLFGIAVPVFTLMTESFGDFADAALQAADPSAAAAAAKDTPALVVRGSSQKSTVAPELRPPSPSYVFFPMAGGTSRQFAATYVALRKEQPDATFYFVQPAGREARAGESHADSIEAYCGPVVQALTAHEAALRNGPSVFVGDSWGSIAALVVAHDLYGKTGFCPNFFVVSGNESPACTTKQNGLGSYDERPMKSIPDEDLQKFLEAAGAEPGTTTPEVVSALRADCELHEAYKKPAKQNPLPCQCVVLYGTEDHVAVRDNMMGWADEADSDEFRLVAVPGASHHMYAEKPAAVARKLAGLVSGGAPLWWKRSSLLRKSNSNTNLLKWLETTPESVETKESEEANESPKQGSASPKVLGGLLGPPYAFVLNSGVDEAALNDYRYGNARYRLGNSAGSRGEVSGI